MLKLLHVTAKLSVLCVMLIGVVLGVNGTSFIACVSVVCILCGLCKVKWQSASSPVAVDLKQKQKNLTCNICCSCISVNCIVLCEGSTVSDIGVT